MVRERLKPTAVLNSWKALHCGALWAGRARKRLRPFILHKIERAEMRLDPSKKASVRAFAPLCTNALRLSKTSPNGYTLDLAHRIAHSGSHGQTGGVSDGGGVQGENAESLRNGDAHSACLRSEASRPRRAALLRCWFLCCTGKLHGSLSLRQSTEKKCPLSFTHSAALTALPVHDVAPLHCPTM